MQEQNIYQSLPIQPSVERVIRVIAAEMGIGKAELIRRAIFHYVGFLAAQKDGPRTAKDESTQALIPAERRYKSTSLELPAEQSTMARMAAETLKSFGPSYRRGDE